MIKDKLLLATTIGLVSASASLLAAPSVSSVASGLKSSSPAVQAENLGANQPSTEGSAQRTTPLITSPVSRQSAFYAGFGIDMINNKGYTGLMPKALAGYGIYYGQARNFYSALEVGGGAGSIPLSTNNTRYRVSAFANLSILPGYMIYDDVLLYARLGAQSTRYTKLNSTNTGGLYGIGLESFSILNSQRWHARFEYDYANNKNLNQFIMDIIYKFGC